jgi:hypothetical protein
VSDGLSVTADDSGLGNQVLEEASRTPGSMLQVPSLALAAGKRTGPAILL